MAKAPFRGRIPDDRHYDPEHDMWVKVEADGQTLRIGASAYGIHLAGNIIGFTAKPKGACIEAGRGLGTVECAKTVIALHAPIGFDLLEANEMAEEQPAIINRDPYESGWMVRARPHDWLRDSVRLVDAATYCTQILHCDPEAEFK